MHSTLQAILQDLETYCEAQEWEVVISTCERLMLYAAEQKTTASSLTDISVGESDMYRVKGHFLETKRDIEGAISAYQQAIALNPLANDIYLTLASLYRQKEEWENVADAYQQSLQVHPNQPDIAVQLLDLLNQTTLSTLAIDVLDKTFSTCPEMISADHHVVLGNLLSQKGKADRAVRCYRAAIAQESEHVEYYVHLANNLRQIKDYPAAMETYRKALKMNSKSDTIRYELGRCLQQQFKFENACTHFQKAIELNPKSALPRVELGKIWHQQGLIKKATQACLDALALDSSLTEPYVKLRYNLLRYDIEPLSPLLEDVCKQCQSILEKKPKALHIQSLLGYALTRKGDCNTAIQYYQTASLQKARLFCEHIADEQWESAQVKAPSFIIIGAFKCATTSLYQYINRHPNIVPSLEKELDFFDRQFDNGLTWYQSHFPPIPSQGHFMTGEATPNYFYGLKTPERIIQSLPDIKLILILRHPINRTVSHYHFLQRNQQNSQSIEEVLNLELERLLDIDPKGKPNWKLLNQNYYIGHSLYFYYLRRWLKYINREQLLVIKHEDLGHTPQAMLTQTFEYLNLPDHQLSEYQKYKAGHYNPLSSEVYQKLSQFFTPHVQALEELLDMEFGWSLD